MEDISSSTKGKGPYIIILAISIGSLLTVSVALSLFYILVMKCYKRRHPNASTLSIQAQPSIVGLDKRILHTVPILFYSTKTCDLYQINQGDQCVICLGRFRKGNAIRRLPICGHVFHVQCIDNWFHAHCNCPICRSPVRMTPLVSSSTRDRVDVKGRGGDGGGLGGITRTRSSGLLCHNSKLVLPIQGLRPRDLIGAGLKRSLSMGQCCIVVDTRESNSASSPFSSSSNDFDPPLSKIDFVLSRLHQTMEPMAPRMLHGLREGQGGTLRDNGILPY